MIIELGFGMLGSLVGSCNYGPPPHLIYPHGLRPDRRGVWNGCRCVCRVGVSSRVCHLILGLMVRVCVCARGQYREFSSTPECIFGCMFAPGCAPPIGGTPLGLWAPRAHLLSRFGWPLGYFGRPSGLLLATFFEVLF